MTVGHDVDAVTKLRSSAKTASVLATEPSPQASLFNCFNTYFSRKNFNLFFYFANCGFQWLVGSPVTSSCYI